MVGQLLLFFTQLIEIEGKAQFRQQLDPLHPNCGSPYRSERGLYDGVPGRNWVTLVSSTDSLIELLTRRIISSNFRRCEMELSLHRQGSPRLAGECQLLLDTLVICC